MFGAAAPGMPAGGATTIVINEAVTDPQTDWSTTRFNGLDGGGEVSDSDEWIELYNAGPEAVSLEDFSLEFNDSSPATLELGAPGSTALVVFGNGTLGNFRPGDYLIIGNPPDAMTNDIHLALRDGAGALVDEVEIGDDPAGDGNGDGAPDGGGTNGDASGRLDEALARVPNGADTDDDPRDFTRQAARLGLDNGGSLTLGEHNLGQAGNALGSGGPAVSGAVLFRFGLTATGEAANAGGLTFDAAATGIASADLANVALIVDANGNGAADPGEASAGTLEAPLDIADGITFSNLDVPAGAGVGYLLQADVGNLNGGETLGLSLAAASIVEVTGGATGKAILPTGAVSAAGHTAPAAPGQVVISEVVTDPQTDWSTNNFDGSPGGGTVSEVDEFVELYIQAAGVNLAGWTIELNDTTPQGGGLAAGGAFAVSRYSGAGGFANTAAGDFLVLGNPTGTGMNNDIYIILRDATGAVVDEVEIGDDPQQDGPGDGAPGGGGANGDAAGPLDEAVARAPDGRDTGDDPDDFVKRAASPGASNGGRLTLAEGGGGQAANTFLKTDGSGVRKSVAEVDLYRFSLRAEGESAVIGRLHFGFLTYELGDEDFEGLRLIEDANGDGVADPGEPVVGSIETPLHIADGLDFTGVGVPQGAASVNYILRGSVRNIRRGTLLDVWLRPEQIEGATGSATGLALGAVGEVSAARHGLFDYTRDVLINEVLPHPGQDYNRDGAVTPFGDEYVELINLSGRAIHIGGWLLDDIPASGSDIYRIAQGTILRPHKVMVIYRGTTHLALNDDYDLVQLRYPDGTLADEVFWERDPGIDYSISRNGTGPGAFSYDWLPTPGMSNLGRPGAGPAPPVHPLAVARGWDDGAYLTVEGWITGPAPMFGPRTIYVQDASGAGIALYLAEGDFPPMSAGQAVWAYGYLRTRTGERELYVESLYQFSLGAAGPGPPPQRVGTGQVGEATEGRLVTLAGTVVRLEADAFWLDDGSGPARVYFQSTTGLLRPSLERGQALEVTGIVSEFTTSQSIAPGYRLLVRTAYDLRLVSPTEAAQEPAGAARPRFERALWRVMPRLGWRPWPR